jgi:hypothetical protein
LLRSQWVTSRWKHSLCTIHSLVTLNFLRFVGEVRRRIEADPGPGVRYRIFTTVSLVKTQHISF